MSVTKLLNLIDYNWNRLLHVLVAHSVCRLLVNHVDQGIRRVVHITYIASCLMQVPDREANRTFTKLNQRFDSPRSQD